MVFNKPWCFSTIIIITGKRCPYFSSKPHLPSHSTSCAINHIFSSCDVYINDLLNPISIPFNLVCNDSFILYLGFIHVAFHEQALPLFLLKSLLTACAMIRFTWASFTLPFTSKRCPYFSSNPISIPFDLVCNDSFIPYLGFIHITFPKQALPLLLLWTYHSFHLVTRLVSSAGKRCYVPVVEDKQSNMKLLHLGEGERWLSQLGHFVC